MLAIVPEVEGDAREAQVALESNGERSASVPFVVGAKLAEDLHLVANPAFDPDDGSLYVTRSGPRGQQMPVTIFRIDASGAIDAFSGDITNPTASLLINRPDVRDEPDGLARFYRLTAL